MREVPAHLQVLTQRFAIEVIDDLYLDDHDNRIIKSEVGHTGVVTKVSGLCDPEGQIILIEGKNASASQALTLLHEVLHACFAAAGISDTVSSEQEESVANRLSPILMTVLQENPDLVRYFEGAS